MTTSPALKGGCTPPSLACNCPIADTPQHCSASALAPSNIAQCSGVSLSGSGSIGHGAVCCTVSKRGLQRTLLAEVGLWGLQVLAGGPLGRLHAQHHRPAGARG